MNSSFLLKRKVLLIALCLLLACNAVVFYFLWFSNDKVLSVSFLDVGQGDAILIQSPGGVDMLIDGGADRSVLRELPKKLGVLDRTIDFVIATHPDMDHIGGLSDVLSRYTVSYVVQPGIPSDTSAAKRFEEAVLNEPNVESIIARRGMRFDLGGGVFAEVLYPDRDVSQLETNTGSIVMRITYGETDFILTGDAPISIEDWIVSSYGTQLKSEVLKAGHHGSRTSTGDKFIKAVEPDIVIISAGKDNSYGHPHPEVVRRIEESGAEMLATFEGTIELVSDGTKIWRKN